MTLQVCKNVSDAGGVTLQAFKTVSDDGGVTLQACKTVSDTGGVTLQACKTSPALEEMRGIMMKGSQTDSDELDAKCSYLDVDTGLS